MPFTVHLTYLSPKSSLGAEPSPQSGLSFGLKSMSGMSFIFEAILDGKESRTTLITLEGYASKGKNETKLQCLPYYKP